MRRIKEYILAGDAFQVVLSQRFQVPRGDVDPFDVYRALRVINPSPYMFHLEFPEAVGHRRVARGAGAAGRRRGRGAADRRHAPARRARPRRTPRWRPSCARDPKELRRARRC